MKKTRFLPDIKHILAVEQAYQLGFFTPYEIPAETLYLQLREFGYKWDADARNWAMCEDDPPLPHRLYELNE